MESGLPLQLSSGDLWESQVPRSTRLPLLLSAEPYRSFSHGDGNNELITMGTVLMTTALTLCWELGLNVLQCRLIELCDDGNCLYLCCLIQKPRAT